MKYTLLDLTQTILSAGDGDEINSITDTVEAQQVAKVIRSVYYDIIDRANLPEQYILFQLEASNDSSKPVVMTLPSTIKNLKWIKYNCATTDSPELNMRDILPIPMEDFLREMYQMNTSDTNVGSMSLISGSDSFTFLFKNDQAPEFYTTWDDNTIIFNSYDSSLDSTLQKSKTQAYGLKTIPWTMSDTFIPDLDDAQFSLLLNESKSLYFQEAKQVPHPLADRNARRGWTNVQKQRNKIFVETDFDKLSNFGRR